LRSQRKIEIEKFAAVDDNGRAYTLRVMQTQETAQTLQRPEVEWMNGPLSVVADPFTINGAPMTMARVNQLDENSYEILSVFGPIKVRRV
jgi:hypothetical protein